MTPASNLRSASLEAQRAALASGAVRAVDLALACLEAIERTRASINAFIVVDPARVLDAARAADARIAAGQAGPLEGLCIAVKDNLDVAGMATTAGMATRRDRAPATEDAPAIARLRAAGAVLLGKLNLHEAALGADNDNPHYGACHHPRRHGWTPGGSSGGAGAAVAAGLCSAAIGTDSMGSIRIPASYCGVYGLKPGRGVVSARGSVVVSRRLDTVGPLARAPGDLAVLLDVLAGHDPACAESQPAAFRAPRPGPLRLGVPDYGDLGVAPDVDRAFRDGCRRLRELGHALVELPAPDPRPGSARRAGLLVCEAEMLVEHADDWRDRRAMFSPLLRKLLAWAEGRSAADFAAADRMLDRATLQVRRWLAECDLVLWPTTPQTAFAFGEPAPANQADLTCFANMAGCPAVSIPLPVADDALPIGLQLIGGAGDELRLLAVARGFHGTEVAR
jgi:aspartyl-tRNA(Asn)/glutamyl-tRNA(Gln) amidotransferase subunit A